mmetsp:Transcript_4661/g.8832  ORF Transcript_4661/g.8832 Transcript_4661/m.8832 type:complete len:211 (+) Transcript_4661:658-1290(+)
MLQKQSSTNTVSLSSPSIIGGSPLIPTFRCFLVIATSIIFDLVPSGTGMLTLTSARVCTHLYLSVCPPLPSLGFCKEGSSSESSFLSWISVAASFSASLFSSLACPASGLTAGVSADAAAFEAGAASFDELPPKNPPFIPPVDFPATFLVGSMPVVSFKSASILSAPSVPTNGEFGAVCSPLNTQPNALNTSPSFSSRSLLTKTSISVSS